jgi:hypothetical protein
MHYISRHAHYSTYHIFLHKIHRAVIYIRFLREIIPQLKVIVPAWFVPVLQIGVSLAGLWISRLPLFWSRINALLWPEVPEAHLRQT